MTIRTISDQVNQAEVNRDDRAGDSSLEILAVSGGATSYMCLMLLPTRAEGLCQAHYSSPHVPHTIPMCHTMLYLRKP